jgi:hypothetical protein
MSVGSGSVRPMAHRMPGSTCASIESKLDSRSCLTRFLDASPVLTRLSANQSGGRHDRKVG